MIILDAVVAAVKLYYVKLSGVSTILSMLFIWIIG